MIGITDNAAGADRGSADCPITKALLHPEKLT
jgi:hypothetical protein